MVTMEELLASQNKKLITIFRGQSIEGSIVGITDKEITLDLGAKSEGILPVREIPKEKLTTIKLGDKLTAYVAAQENESGQVVLSATYQPKQSALQSRGRGIINWQRFAAFQNQKSKLSGKVLEINKGGLIVEVDSVRGFLPNSQVGFELLSKSAKGIENQADGLASLIGQTITVTVSEIDQNNNKLIFSQRGNIADAVKVNLSNFKTNQKTKGKIVAILPFGLVIDISGTEGLVFISEVDWEKVEDLTKFKVGQEIEVKVLSLDEDLGRLNLSIKQLSEDPFLKLADMFSADEVVKGTVISVSDAGVVFKLQSGEMEIEGLLPAAKMDPATTYDIGKSMSLLIDSVDLSRRRINLAPLITSTAGLIYK